MVAFLFSALLAIPADLAPGRLGSQMVTFLLSALLAITAGPAPGRLGSQMVAFLLDAVLASQAEPAPGRLGSQMVTFVALYGPVTDPFVARLLPFTGHLGDNLDPWL